MTYCQMLVSPEAVYNCVAALGEIGKVQFKDVIKIMLFCFSSKEDMYGSNNQNVHFFIVKLLSVEKYYKRM